MQPHALPPASTSAANPPLTADQRAALKKLHEAATEFEGVFLQMVMQSMRATVPQLSIFGHRSAAEQTWQGMLDDEYAQGMAKGGGLGLAAQLEQQLRARVLGDASAEAKASVNGRIAP